MTIINYKKLSCQYNTRREKQIKVYWRLVVAPPYIDTTSPLEKIHQDGYSVIVKGYTMTLKIAACIVRAITGKQTQQNIIK